MTNNSTQTNNFFLLRLLAAAFVLISTAFVILQKDEQQPALWYNGTVIHFGNVGIGIFFTIAGFLGTASLFNSDSLLHFFSKRIKRLLPTLFAANIVCVVAGSFITNLSFEEFVSNQQTWSFLLKNSTLVFYQPQLPGVFSEMKNTTINPSIKVVRILGLCYLILLAGSYQVVTRKWLYAGCFILCQLLLLYWMPVQSHLRLNPGVGIAISYGNYFFIGSLLYCFKDEVRFKWFYANILMAIAFATVSTPFAGLTLSIFFAYSFIIIGTSASILKTNIYPLSYSIYLYAFPVQQSLVWYLGYDISVYLLLALSIPVVVLMAIITRSVVEKATSIYKSRWQTS